MMRSASGGVVVTTLIGGLGNQLFQYAAGRAVALRTGRALALDIGWLSRPPAGITPRRYELDAFKPAGAVVEIYGVSRTVRAREALQLAPRVCREGRDDIVAAIGTNRDIRLVGYWQSERYFADCVAAIRGDLELRRPLNAANAELAAAMVAGQSASVHVRRGDYASDAHVTARHPPLGADYYAAAANELSRTCVVDSFFVFSDDVAWCKSHLSLPGPTVFVEGNDENPAADLRLMSLCRHHVIANSSFSWWGAWLDPRKDARVIAPERWHGRARATPDDLLPAGWHRL